MENYPGSSHCSGFGFWNSTLRECYCPPNITHLLSFSPKHHCAAELEPPLFIFCCFLTWTGFLVFCISLVKLVRLTHWTFFRKPDASSSSSFSSSKSIPEPAGDAPAAARPLSINSQDPPRLLSSHPQSPPVGYESGSTCPGYESGYESGSASDSGASRHNSAGPHHYYSSFPTTVDSSAPSFLSASFFSSLASKPPSDATSLLSSDAPSSPSSSFCASCLTCCPSSPSSFSSSSSSSLSSSSSSPSLSSSPSFCSTFPISRFILYLSRLKLFPFSFCLSWLLMGFFIALSSLLLLLLAPLSWATLATLLLATFFPAILLMLLGFSMYSAWFTLYFLSLSTSQRLSSRRFLRFLVTHVLFTLLVLLSFLLLLVFAFLPLSPSTFSLLNTLIFSVNSFFYLTVLIKLVFALWLFRRKFYANPISRRSSFARAMHLIYVLHWVLCLCLLLFFVAWCLSFFLGFRQDIHTVESHYPPAQPQVITRYVNAFATSQSIYNTIKQQQQQYENQHPKNYGHDYSSSIYTLVTMYIGALLIWLGGIISQSTIADREIPDELDLALYFPLGFFWFPCLKRARSKLRNSFDREEENQAQALISDQDSEHHRLLHVADADNWGEETDYST